MITIPGFWLIIYCCSPVLDRMFYGSNPYKMFFWRKTMQTRRFKWSRLPQKRTEQLLMAVSGQTEFQFSVAFFWRAGGGGMLAACGSSQARTWTHTTAVTRAIAVTMPDPYPLCHWGFPINLWLKGLPIKTFGWKHTRKYYLKQALKKCMLYKQNENLCVSLNSFLNYHVWKGRERPRGPETCARALWLSWVDAWVESHFPGELWWLYMHPGVVSAQFPRPPRKLEQYGGVGIWVEGPCGALQLIQLLCCQAEGV